MTYNETEKSLWIVYSEEVHLRTFCKKISHRNCDDDYPYTCSIRHCVQRPKKDTYPARARMICVVFTCIWCLLLCAKGLIHKKYFLPLKDLFWRECLFGLLDRFPLTIAIVTNLWRFSKSQGEIAWMNCFVVDILWLRMQRTNQASKQTNKQKRPKYISIYGKRIVTVYLNIYLKLNVYPHTCRV